MEKKKIRKRVYLVSKKADMEFSTSDWKIDKCFNSRSHTIHYLEQQTGFENIRIRWKNPEVDHRYIDHRIEILNGWKLDIIQVQENRIDVKGKRVQQILTTLSSYDEDLLREYYQNKTTRIPLEVPESISERI